MTITEIRRLATEARRRYAHGHSTSQRTARRERVSVTFHPPAGGRRAYYTAEVDGTRLRDGRGRWAEYRRATDLVAGIVAALEERA